MSKKESLTELEVLVPPWPQAALMAKPANEHVRPTGLEQQVADLREVVARLAGRVEQLEGIVAEQQTVCCECGVPGCRKAPLVPMRYWMRYGPMSFRYFQRDNPEGARSAEREHYEFRRQQRPDARFFEERMLNYDPALDGQPRRAW